jgi:hypothetical protein
MIQTAADLLEGALTDIAVKSIAGSAGVEPPRRWWLDPVDYPFGTPTTLGAVRLRGDTGSDRPWSVFVKVVRSFRHWPLIDTLPPEGRAKVIASPLWRYEADVYASGMGALLPQGMRLPALYGVIDLGDDRLGVAMEDVPVHDGAWDAARFARAAELLGRMSARLTRHDALPPAASRVPGEMTEQFYVNRLLIAEIPAFADDRTWAHPLLAPHQDLRADLERLAARLPGLIAALKRLPQFLMHGDASPQNLLVPADRPDTFVAIDWSLGGLAAPGDDLGQLLIGLAHAGTLGVADLAALRPSIVDAYTAGLRAEGAPCDEADVRYGLDGGLQLRSTFTALPLGRLGEPLTDDLAAHIERRIELTRYLVDLGLALSHST